MDTIEIVDRPWGYYEVLSIDVEKNYWIKRLIIRPLSKISLQSHENRDEHWTVISGIGVAEVDSEKAVIEAGSTTFIPKQTKHRIQNISKTELLIICEVAIGKCEESDIERFSDDYGRK